MFRKYTICGIVLILGLILACTGLGTARAASVDSLTFDCLAVHVKGHTTVSARMVRITITLASNLTRTS